MLTSLHDELRCVRTGLGGSAALAAEAAGGLWRGVLGALQLLVLNQAGWRPLGEEVRSRAGWEGVRGMSSG